MRTKFILFALCAVFFFCSLSLGAVDFGVVLIQDAEVDVPGFNFKDTGYGISGVFVPWFSALIEDTGDLYISAAVNYEIDPFAIIPELTRTDFAFNLGPADIRAGRMFYSDPLGLIANNLFDGAQVTFITGFGNFHAGAWYTGFLYRKRAAITMKDNELQSSYVKVDNSDFANTYFAPSRVFGALEYGHSSLAGFIGVNLSLIAQFDMESDKLHSQYFTAALSVPARFVIFDLGGCFELIEYNNDMTSAFAADAGLTFILPAKLEKHIKLSGRYSSGAGKDKTFGAFLPLTTVPLGEILEAKFSGLSVLCAEFTGRMTEPVSANIAFTYFIRNDLRTYRSYPVLSGASQGYFLGGEVFGRLIWNISTGARLNLGTGVFLPSLGDAGPDENMIWRTNLSLVISIY